MPALSAEKQWAAELSSLKEKKLYRSFFPVTSRRSASRLNGGLADFSSNNYLGLSFHPRVIRAGQKALTEWGGTSGASRLISGDLAVHSRLERELAKFKGEEDALVFASGYMAALGAVTALVDEKDVVLLDRLDHASLVDAARLSRAKLWVYPHGDARALEALLKRAGHFRRRLVITDAYFSMDGDVAPIPQILDACRKHEAMLMIDEAHSTGVYGKNGRGLSVQLGLEGQVDVVMGTLSKALGSAGGFIAGKKTLKRLLVNRARTLIYTTGPSPAASACALESLKVLSGKQNLVSRLWENTAIVRKGLGKLGLDLMGSEGPIIPVKVGDTAKVLALRDFLRKKGVFAPAVRPPTVPRGGDRLRLSVTAAHGKEELTRLLGALEKAKGKFL